MTQDLVLIGGAVIAIGLLGLLTVFLKERLERPERAKAFYRVDAMQVFYLYSYTEFRRYPQGVRARLLQERQVAEWFEAETHRHGGEMLASFDTRFKKLRYRAFMWLLNFLT